MRSHFACHKRVSFIRPLPNARCVYAVCLRFAGRTGVRDVNIAVFIARSTPELC